MNTCIPNFMLVNKKSENSQLLFKFKKNILSVNILHFNLLLSCMTVTLYTCNLNGTNVFVFFFLTKKLLFHVFLWIYFVTSHLWLFFVLLTVKWNYSLFLLICYLTANNKRQFIIYMFLTGNVKATDKIAVVAIHLQRRQLSKAIKPLLSTGVCIMRVEFVPKWDNFNLSNLSPCWMGLVYRKAPGIHLSCFPDAK